ncbi:MAG: ACS family MFS transporter [Pseudomonadota bacterium]
MAEVTQPGGWQTRYRVIAMCFLATFICYIDRVNISVAIIPMAAEFNWDKQTQGVVLSSFFIGYMVIQIVGGRLADRYGGAIVLGMGVLLWSLFTIVTPWAAWMGFVVLLLARIGMGMGEAVTFPSVYSMVSRWFPDGERSKALALNASGIPTGTVFALLVTPIIVQTLGWEWAFYLFGLVGVVWYALWRVLVTATPQQHPNISPEELAYIEANAPASGVAAERPSWGTMLSNLPLWAIIVAHFANNWTLYVVLSWLPIYVNEQLGVDFASVGLISMLPHIASLIALNVLGNIADRLLSGGYNVTIVRKSMQTIAFGGLAVCLLFVAQATSVWAAISLMCLGKVFGAFGMGGYGVNHMDLGPKHAGTLMGITNTAGTIPGIIGVYVTGWILNTTGSWEVVWQTTAGVTLFGMLFYLLFASGEKQFD